MLNDVGLPLLIKLDKSEGGFGIHYCDSEQAIVEKLNNIEVKTGSKYLSTLKSLNCKLIEES